MLTLNDTALTDREAIWVIRIDTDTPIYISTAVDKITLSGTDYDGKVILKDSLSDGGKAIDISYGGGIGSVGSFEFSIARYTLNALTNGYFNEYYPTTSMPYLISRVISVGFLWEGATTEAEITWFFYGYIDDYSYDSDKITLSCLEYAELENVELPYYKVQKEYDNGISYFTVAPDESYGLSIPILYGDFLSLTSTKYNDFKVAPVVAVDKRYLQFMVASHKCNGVDGAYQVQKFLSGANTYMYLVPEDGENQNTYAGHWIRLYKSIRTADTRIYGQLWLQMNMVGGVSEVNDIENAIDSNQTNYMVISNTLVSNKAAFKLDISLSDSDVGILDDDAADILFQVDWACDEAANRDIEITYYHPQIAASPADPSAGVANYTHNATTQTSTAINIGAFTGCKIADSNGDVILPWTIEELIGLEWIVENQTASPPDEDIRIYTAFLYIKDILVSGIIGRQRSMPTLRRDNRRIR